LKICAHLRLSAAKILCFFAVAFFMVVHSYAARHTTPQPSQIKADRIVILKSERTLTLMHDGKPFKTYKVALGGQPIGPKTQQGDHKTPEGTYTIDSRNLHSQYYKGLHVSYPSAQDAAQARKRGVSPGGAIMIHGLPNGMRWVGSAHLAHDWTDGCIAVTDEEIDEIWKLVPNGTPVEIKP
jgi:murein L,D-transpeptidase YafK